MSIFITAKPRRLYQKACTMKYTQNIGAHTVTTHIQPQNPEIIYEHLPYCSYQPYSFKCENTFLWLHKVIQIAQRHPLCRPYIIIQYRRSYEQYHTT